MWKMKNNIHKFQEIVIRINKFTGATMITEIIFYIVFCFRAKRNGNFF